jgi:hypothetical protein
MFLRISLILFFFYAISVLAQANIGAEENNIIYRGLANPLSVACGNKDSFYIKAKSPSLELTNEQGRFYLNCLSVKEDTAFITFGLQNSNLERKFIFQVADVPKPEILLGAMDPSKSINKSALMVQGAMGAVLNNFIYNGVKYSIRSYRMSYFDYINLEIRTIDVQGSSLAPIKPALMKLNAGDFFEISNIELLGPDNKITTISKVSVMLN